MATVSDMRMCRTIGHSWDALGADKENRYEWIISLRCERCGTNRTDRQQKNGHMTKRRYEYPYGYRDADVVIEGNAEDRRAWLLQELLKPSVPIEKLPPPERNGSVGG